MERTKRILAAAAVCAALWVPVGHAQSGFEPPRINGYFQTRFSSEIEVESQERQTTFTLQQLNVLFQQQLSTSWSSFVDVQAVNSFDSERGWGAMSIEEAWVRYHRSRYISVKLGLLIPTFNRFNELKNRMPVHPYIIRPLVYESSFAQIIAIDEFVPRQAYVEVYGSKRIDRVSVEYSTYLGNSRHINGFHSDVPGAETGVTGVDTSAAFMGGIRVGLRHKDTTVGVSFTGEPVDLNDFLPGAADTLDISPDAIDNVAFTRLGLDFYTRIWRVDLEAEYINVDYNLDVHGVDLDKRFWYMTLGYYLGERWYIYSSLWKTEEALWHPALGELHRDFTIGGMGARYSVNERLAFKVQFGRGEYESRELDLSEFDFEHTALGASVFF